MYVTNFPSAVSMLEESRKTAVTFGKFIQNEHVKGFYDSMLDHNVKFYTPFAEQFDKNVEQVKKTFAMPA